MANAVAKKKRGRPPIPDKDKAKNTGPKMVAFSMPMTAKMHRALKKKAKEESISMRAVVLRVLKDYLEL